MIVLVLIAEFFSYSFDFELYYDGGKDNLVIKGTDTRFITRHQMIPYITKCIKMFEMLDQKFVSYREVYSFIHSLRNDYVNKILPTGCYREINYQNPYAIYDTIEKTMKHHDIFPKGSQYELIINYNFVRFLIPFINLLSRYRSQAYYKNGKSYGKR